MVAMSKQAPTGAFTAGAVASVPFEERDFTTAQVQQLLAVGKTTLFTTILPQLETYFEGTRRKITGRSIRAYRDRKLAEPRQKRPTEQLRKPKTRNEKRRSRP